MKKSSDNKFSNFKLEDDLIYDTNECTDENGEQQEMSPFMVSLATSVRSDVGYIIESFGQEVGQPVIRIVLDLLEKMIEISNKNDRLSAEFSLYSTENTQLKRTIEKEKINRLDAETNMFQMEEEVIIMRKNIRNYESRIETLEKQLIYMKCDENFSEGDTLKLVRTPKKLAINESNLSATTGDNSPKNSTSNDDYLEKSSKYISEIVNEVKSSHMTKNSIFYDIVNNKENWEKLASKIERGRGSANSQNNEHHSSLKTEIRQHKSQVNDGDIRDELNYSELFEDTQNLKEIVEPGLEELLVRYKYLLEENKKIIPKMQELNTENEEAAKELDRVSNDLFRVKNELAGILDKSLFLPEYVRRLHKEITELNHRVRVLYKDNKENESSVDVLRKICDYWKHTTKIYRARLAELQEAVEWNENYNSCLVPTVSGPVTKNIEKPSTLKNLFSKFMKKAKIQLKVTPKANMECIDLRRKFDSVERMNITVFVNPITKISKENRESFISRDKLDLKAITECEHYVCVPDCELEYKSTPLFVKPLISKDVSKVWIAELVDFSENSQFKEHEFQKTLWVLSLGQDNSTVKVIDMSNYNNILSSFVLASCNAVSIAYVRESDINSDFTSLSQGHEDFITKSNDISYDSNAEYVTSCNVFSEIPSYLPTVWVGTKNGRLQVHSAVDNYNDILATVQLNTAIVSIVHISGRVFMSLFSGAIAIFQRDSNTEKWNFSAFRIIKFSDSMEQFGCMVKIRKDMLWCGVENRILEFNAVETIFQRCIYTHPLTNICVRSISASKDYAAVMFRGLQYVNLFSVKNNKLLAIINPFENIKCFNEEPNGLRITSTLIYNQRMVVGSSNGHMITVSIDKLLKSKTSPTSNKNEYKVGIYSVCHTSSVKFILGIDFAEELRTYVIITGGEGVKNMKMMNNDVSWEVTDSSSHLLVWAENV